MSWHRQIPNGDIYAPVYPGLRRGLLAGWNPAVGFSSTTLHATVGNKTHKGTLTNSPACVSSPLGKVIDYVNNNSLVTVDDTNLWRGTFTWSVWINSHITNYTSSGYILAFWEAATNRRSVGLRIESGANRFDVLTSFNGTNPSNTSFTRTVETGWHHVVLVKKNNKGGSDFDLYYDGSFHSSVNVNFESGDNDARFTIGGLHGSTAGFDGEIGPVLYYERLLKPNDIRLLYRDPHAAWRTQRPIVQTEASAGDTEVYALLMGVGF